MEVRTVAAWEVVDIGLVAEHRTVLVVEALRIGLAGAVHHTVLEEEVRRTGPEEVRRTGPEEVHHTDLAEEVADPTAAAVVALHTGPEEVVRRTG